MSRIMRRSTKSVFFMRARSRWLFLRPLAVIAAGILVLGCQMPEKKGASPETAGQAPTKAEAPANQTKPEEPKKSGLVGGAVKLPVTVIDGAGRVFIVPFGTVVSFIGEAFGGAGNALDKAAKSFLGAGVENINTEQRVTYAQVDGETLAMDVFWPKGKGPFPMIVNVHGGSFHKKDQEQFCEPMCKWLCNQGYTVFNISYRLAPEHRFPDSVNDALGAVIFAKTNAAKYQADPARAAIMGDSAGGNIAAMCALCWDNPTFKPSYRGDGKVTAQTQANVFLFGVFDLVAMYNMFGWYVIFENPKDIGKMYMGGTPADMLDRYKMASPANHVRKDMSPTLLVCGANDPLLPQSEGFHKKLDEMGIRNGLYLSIGDTHGFTAVPTKGAADAYNAVNAFLALELKHSSSPLSPPAAPSKK